MERVNEIKTTVGPTKQNNEEELKSHLDAKLEHVATTEPTLPQDFLNQQLVQEQGQGQDTQPPIVVPSQN